MPQAKSLALILTAVICIAGFVAVATAQEAPQREPAQPVVTPADKPADAPATDQPGEPGEPGEPEKAPPQSPFGGWGFPIMLLGGMGLLYFFSGRSRRKQAATRKEMLENLRKGDKVTSIGGVIGTVMDAREDEVIVKVDESSNTRMHFARWAIRGVGDTAKEEERK